jgi:hypothetical protein
MDKAILGPEFVTEAKAGNSGLAAASEERRRNSGND